MKLIIKENDTYNFLNTKLEKVNDPGAKVEDLKKMLKIMRENNGVGITANQCGLLDAMFIFTRKKGIEFAINPRILSVSKKKKSMVEGCLSYPGIKLSVSSPINALVSYCDGKKMVRTKLSGLECRIFMHEMKHINGRCPMSKI